MTGAPNFGSRILLRSMSDFELRKSECAGTAPEPELWIVPLCEGVAALELCPPPGELCAGDPAEEEPELWLPPELTEELEPIEELLCEPPPPELALELALEVELEELPPAVVCWARSRVEIRKTQMRQRPEIRIKHLLRTARGMRVYPGRYRPAKS